jgi:uncharacterized repeat protein (TIGR02543 family)/uncharacterized repeat protein (TIGR01451 family)
MVQVQLKVKVKTDIPDIATIENQGGIEIDDSGTVDATELVKNPVIPDDNKVVDVDNGSVVKKGDELTYTISHLNDTTATQKVVITDSLPQYTEFVSASTGAVLVGELYTWTFDTVAPGEMVQVQLKVKVTGDIPDVADVINQGKISLDDGDAIDTTKVINPICPDENKVVDVDSGTTVKPNDTLTYTITHVNETNASQRVVITDSVPEYTSFVSASAPYTKSGDSITWTFASVAPGKMVQVQLTVKVDADIFDIATVVNQGGIELNNSGKKVATKLVENPIYPTDDKVVSVGSGTTVEATDTITYTISHINDTTAAQHVVITDRLPEYTTFVRASAGAVLIDGLYTWTFASVAPGKMVQVQLTVKVISDAPYNTTIKNQGGIEIDNSGVINKTALVENPIRPPWNIYYDVTGGENASTNPTRYDKGSAFPLTVTAPVRRGYDFVGWTVDFSDYTADITSPQATVNIWAGTTGDIYFTAHWKPGLADYGVEHYLVDPDGTITLEGIDWKKGITGTMAYSWARVYANYRFNPSFYLYKGSGIIEAEGTLRLRFYYTRGGGTGGGEETPLYVQVIFVDHDGTVLKVEDLLIGADATAPDDPLRDGYTFYHWDKDFSNVQENLTVQAQYIKPSIEGSRITDPVVPESDGTPTITIFGTDIPLYSGDGTGSWSLFDLLCTLAAIILAIICAIRFIRARRNKDDEEDIRRRATYNQNTQQYEYAEKIKRRRLPLLIASIIIAILAIILFIITQDITQPVVIFDRWSIVFAIGVVLAVVALVLVVHKKKEEETYEDFEGMQVV